MNIHQKMVIVFGKKNESILWDGYFITKNRLKHTKFQLSNGRGGGIRQ